MGIDLIQKGGPELKGGPEPMRAGNANINIPYICT
jgi:hypothetical protein